MNSSLLARPLRAKAVSCLAPLCIARRNIVYVRDGKTTVRGLKKNEDDYLTASNGVKYPGNIDTLKPAKEFLGDEYALEDSLILQAITHKSFAHGKKPYNEKLAVIGREFLRLQSMAYAVKNDKSTYAVQLVNGVNFEAHKNGAVRQIFASKTGYELCKRAGIDRSIFWKKPTDEANASSGEVTVFSRCIAALVGAVLLRHGEKKASQFVQDRIVKGPHSVVELPF